MKVKIKTLTPVHIGTGKKLGSLEFFNNYRIDYYKLFELVAQEKQEEFFNWVDQNPQISVLDIKNRFKLNQQDIINNCGLYSFSVSFQSDLNEGIKDSSNKLFIPGSSLKGSLRTALMYKVLSNDSKLSFLNNHLANLINQANNLRGNKSRIKNLLKEADDKLEEEVFNCGVYRERNNKIVAVYDDQKYDLLKLVKISDSTSVTTYFDGEITELQVYALQKIPPHKSFKIYTESIKDNVTLEFDISIDIEFLKRAKDELNKTNSDFGKKYFIGIEQKLKELFDVDIKNESEFSEEKIIESLLKSWEKFGEAVSVLEQMWVKSVDGKGNANTGSLKKLYNTKNKFKIGFGTGFSGMTILPLLLSDKSLTTQAEQFYKSVGIGFHNSSKSPLSIYQFPFTRKYTNNQAIYGGFGWVQLIRNASDVKSEKEESFRPPNTVLAEIIDDKSKPPKVKILEGDYQGKETIFPGVKLEGLGLSKGSKVYVKLHFDKKNLQKAEFKGKVE